MQAFTPVVYTPDVRVLIRHFQVKICTNTWVYFNSVKYLLGYFLSGLDSLPRLLHKTLKSEVIIQGTRVQIKFKTVN